MLLGAIAVGYKKNGSCLTRFDINIEDNPDGYFAAREQIQEYSQAGEPITEDKIKIIHALVKTNKNNKSVYRKGPRRFENQTTGKEIYRAPSAKKVSSYMTGLICWLNNSNSLPAPVRATIFHHEFVKIHPFNDGNGRTARLITSLILALSGYDLSTCFALEEYFSTRDRKNYRLALRDDLYYNARIDITLWLEYFFRSMYLNLQNLENYHGK